MAGVDFELMKVMSSIHSEVQLVAKLLRSNLYR